MGDGWAGGGRPHCSIMPASSPSKQLFSSKQLIPVVWRNHLGDLRPHLQAGNLVMKCQDTLDLFVSSAAAGHLYLIKALSSSKFKS